MSLCYPFVDLNQRELFLEIEKRGTEEDKISKVIKFWIIWKPPLGKLVGASKLHITPSGLVDWQNHNPMCRELLIRGLHKYFRLFFLTVPSVLQLSLLRHCSTLELDACTLVCLQGSPRQNPKSPRAASAKRATSPQPPRNGSPTNRRPRSAAVPASPRSHEEEVEPASVVVQ